MAMPNELGVANSVTIAGGSLSLSRPCNLGGIHAPPPPHAKYITESTTPSPLSAGESERRFVRLGDDAAPR
ncbi:hypothetical protein FA13DRAFT_1741229 [Coprinellus micaceus]|uniref:Uncharacterized protein n=1 Tax=Coprinellus micaceus TaxID=71717 RepID=A0A4Y7SJX2_COPMI|nr:hypothetical protein FA13DRAFT_1741229 [Coprinellus micaceus]